MTGRDITVAAQAALDQANCPVVVFVEMDFPSGYLRLNSSGVHLAWNGATWYGAGRMAGLSELSEGGALEARGVSFSMSGLLSEHVAIALGQQYQGRRMRLWLAPLDANYQPVADPVLVGRYRMDTMDITLGESATITVGAESRLADWDRPRVRRYNAGDQNVAFPDDKGFEFVPQMAEKQLLWGIF